MLLDFMHKNTALQNKVILTYVGVFIHVSSEDSPAKRQRRGVKVVPSRKRCKALESISGKDSQQKKVNIKVTISNRHKAGMIQLHAKIIRL